VLLFSGGGAGDLRSEHVIGQPSEYDRVAKGLHWLVVVLLVVQFGVAWTMPDVSRDTKPIGLIAWHLSIGVFILLVMLVRLGWRAISDVPPVPADLAPPLRLLSRATHFLLYGILIVQPLLGWINASARGWAVKLFGVIPLPALAPSGSSWGRAMGDVHQIVAFVLLGAVGLHVLGALYHQFILKDALLRRMLPGRR
jgi:cytochrome b561